jgi:hypothetical protein
MGVLRLNLEGDLEVGFALRCAWCHPAFDLDERMGSTSRHSGLALMRAWSVTACGPIRPTQAQPHNNPRPARPHRSTPDARPTPAPRREHEPALLPNRYVSRCQSLSVNIRRCQVLSGISGRTYPQAPNFRLPPRPIPCESGRTDSTPSDIVAQIPGRSTRKSAFQSDALTKEST